MHETSNGYSFDPQHNFRHLQISDQPTSKTSGSLKTGVKECCQKEFKMCKTIFWVSFAIFLNFILLTGSIKYLKLVPAVDIRVHLPNSFLQMNVTLTRAIEIYLRSSGLKDEG